MSASSFATRFIDRLVGLETPAGLFNPWASVNADDAPGNGPGARLERLGRHLAASQGVLFVAVGEAPSYQGARISGIPFTSEALLLEDQCPRIGRAPARLSTRPRPWSEPSGRILWGLLHQFGMAEHTILWNACPFHPFGENPLSNRAPTAGEVRMGLPLLELLADAHPSARFLAIGNRAAAALGMLGIPHTPMRHPAYGGKNELEGQLRAIS